MGDDASDTRLGTGKRLIFATVFVLVVSALGLAATEAVLRLLAPEYEYLVWAPGVHLVFNPEPGAMPGVGRNNQFTTNSLGIRGDELSVGDDYRMLTLGGSTTECLFLDDSEAWPHLLQQRLNEYQSQVKVWVGNIGKSGHSTRDHLLQMELLVPRYPEIDAVILLVGANDLLVHLRIEEGSPSGSPETLGDKEQLLLHAFTEFPLRGKNFFERTRIWRGIARLTERMKATRQVAVQDRAGSALTTWRRARRSAPKIGELPDLSEAIEEYKENLRAIADIGQRHGIRTILITQPTMWQSDVPPELDRLLLMGARGGFPIANTYYTVDALTQALRAYNTALWSVCSELLLDCVDLTPVLPQDTSVFYDDFHFNESGADKVATALATQLIRWPPFSKSVAGIDLPDELEVRDAN